MQLWIPGPRAGVDTLGDAVVSVIVLFPMEDWRGARGYDGT